MDTTAAETTDASQADPQTNTPLDVTDGGGRSSCRLAFIGIFPPYLYRSSRFHSVACFSASGLLQRNSQC
jgi:hypothetical protein